MLLKASEPLTHLRLLQNHRRKSSGSGPAQVTDMATNKSQGTLTTGTSRGEQGILGGRGQGRRKGKEGKKEKGDLHSSSHTASGEGVLRTLITQGALKLLTLVAQ